MDDQTKPVLTRSDFRQLARLHQSELPDTGFLSECSNRFIGFFYESVYRMDLGVLVVSRDTGPPHGFALFVKDQNTYMKRLLKNRFYQILQYPSAYRPICRRLLKRNGATFDYKAELTYIVVARHRRNSGVASRLISCGETRLRTAQIREYHVQVYAGSPAVSLYRKNQFEKVKKFDTEYGTKYLMKKRLG